MDDKKVSINLNIYRNQNYRLESQCKKLYAAQVLQAMEEARLTDFKFDRPVKVTFQLFKKTRIRTDKSNFFSIHSKYLYDALADIGVFEDDNDDYIKTEVLLPTVHDKENPRVEFTFTEIED